ncbi:MAG: universal stress protein [Betaproteobacteria bacterium]|nr:universal stress protein [Betaproteobacteria bacterium]MDH3436485.1 universal stress protein [Betaproteobacteria bacterium]
MKILVPVDGSKCSNRAVDHLIRKLGWFKGGVEIHLLNVQRQIPYGRRVSAVVGHDRIAKYHQEEGLAALKSARRKLDAAKAKYVYHIGVGEEAEVICRYATDKGVDQIFMGTRGLGQVSTLVLGSVATKVIHLSPVPVLLVK